MGHAPIQSAIPKVTRTRPRYIGLRVSLEGPDVTKASIGRRGRIDLRALAPKQHRSRHRQTGSKGNENRRQARRAADQDVRPSHEIARPNRDQGKASAQNGGGSFNIRPPPRNRRSSAWLNSPGRTRSTLALSIAADKQSPSRPRKKVVRDPPRRQGCLVTKRGPRSRRVALRRQVAAEVAPLSIAKRGRPARPATSIRAQPSCPACAPLDGCAAGRARARSSRGDSR